MARAVRVLVWVSVVVVGIALFRQGARFDERARVMELQLVGNSSKAATILADWGSTGRLACAVQNLELDRAYINLYALLGILVALAGVVSIPKNWRSRTLTAVLIALPLLAPAAGIADILENQQAHRQIELTRKAALAAGFETVQCAPTPKGPAALKAQDLLTRDFGNAVNWTRFWAIAKFLLLIGALCGLAVIGGVQAVRWRTRGTATDGVISSPGTFEALVNSELTAIRPGRPNDRRLTTEAGPAGEQWVPYRNSDVVGIGLSGGGIRSATFNLGLLQGFAGIRGGKLLELIDYLATISGGGYVGGAWSAFMARHECGGTGRDFFVRPNQRNSRGEAAETEPVRHLREFSNFLVPRWGFFSVEFWQAIVVLISGLLSSLVLATSLVALALMAYAASTSHAALTHRAPGIVFSVLLAAVVLFSFEAWWRHDQDAATPGDEDSNRDDQFTIHVASSILALGVLALVLAGMSPSHKGLPVDPVDRWAKALGVGANVHDWWFNGHLFDSAVAAGICALILISVRFVLMLLRRTGDGEPVLIAFDRTLMRMVGIAAVFAAVAVVWHIGVNFQYFREWLAALAAASGGAFALLRNWLNTLQKPQSPGMLERMKPLLPQILAYLTIILWGAVIVSLLVQYAGGNLLAWLVVALFACLALVVGLFVDPQSFGFHAFYRDRIARAYVGASNPLADTADKNRHFYVRPHDDVSLDDLCGRPLHLICCAANDLSGDPVAGLSRGARSAVLSQQGISIGDSWASAGRLSLGSALTASAAAFNSNMGSVSVELGPAVTFLMCALNLRLGLWIRHPANSRTTPMATPGTLFYKEMFQSTAAADTDDVHLSDGAHFDNLGLYELVRRHCRYVIISDATADPDVAFDDFGIAARKIRQDFGVDIQIDLGPLKPDAEGYSRQHMVVGTIDYGSLDQGVLLYIKPALTGDEEPDVRQYRRRNASFPHETTGDQFYDEAQWESYRRLGDHTADSAFRFLNRMKKEQLTPRGIFTEARREWYPTSPDLAARVIGMTTRLTAIEGDLRNDDAATISREVFPELAALTAPPPTRQSVARQEVANLSWLLRVLQLMEDTWVQCDLDTLWNHPLNLGWMNVFARWATAPTFQMWWPVLSPMYGSGFLRFMNERWPMLKSLSAGTATVKLEGRPVGDGIAHATWPHVLDPIPTDKSIFSYTIKLTRGAQQVELQVGLAAISIDNGVARWNAEQLFVPPSLWNGGIGTDFLARLLKLFKDGGPSIPTVRECRVTISQAKSDPASKAEQIGYLDFYKPAGFDLRESEVPEHEFELVCKFS